MRVVPFVTKHERRAYRGRRKVQVGETCYAIQDETTKLYFAWSYTSETFASAMTHKLSIGDATDIAFNWRRDVHDTTVSSRETM